MRKSFMFMLTLLLLALGTTAAAASPNPPGIAQAIAAQERHNASLLARADVVGTAVGINGANAVIKVFTAGPGVAGIPSSLDGVSVVVQPTGRINALHHKPGHGGGGGGNGGGGGTEPPPEPATTDVWPRPVPIGISTGNEGSCSAGTIGARVVGDRDGDGVSEVYALSNNHVYALENNAPLGSNVHQPGLFDTGCVADPNNVIGTLSDFVSIVFDGQTENRVDAAIAASSTANLGNATPSSGYGLPKSGSAAASVGQTVQKFGRTTELTKGVVTAINASVKVGYSAGTALFVDQLIVESRKPFIKSGDSGSLLVSDPSREPVGLLFAGNVSGKLAVANQVGDVLDAFGVSVDGE